MELVRDAIAAGIFNDLVSEAHAYSFPCQLSYAHGRIVHVEISPVCAQEWRAP